ncbi:MAG: helix-turn-helix transcriptional regulator [bacterium]|nr:helix-turn-helix transcriptional regulator [bacterium]
MTEQEFYARLGARLRAAREAAGLTQREVANRLGLHRPAMTITESGGRRVMTWELVQLATIYNVSIQQLLPLGETAWINNH